MPSPDDASAHLTGTCGLPVDRILAIASSLAGTKPRFPSSGPDKIVQLSGDGRRVVFAVRNRRNKDGLIFSLVAGPEGERTKVICSIDDYVPVKGGMFSKPTVWGFYLYAYFLEALDQQLRAADRTARVRVVK